jgi:hypothetical protein
VWTIVDPIVAYHLVLYFNLSSFISANNLPANTTEQVINILLMQEEISFPIIGQLLNAETLEQAWQIIDPFLAAQLAATFRLPNNTYNSTVDVLITIISMEILNMPAVQALLNDSEISELIQVFNVTYMDTGNMDQSIMAVLNYLVSSENEAVLNRTKEIIASLWPSFFPQIANDTDEKVIAGKALGAAIDSVEGFFGQFGITVPTKVPPTVTTPEPPTTTRNPLDILIQQIIDAQSRNLTLIGVPSTNNTEFDGNIVT